MGCVDISNPNQLKLLSKINTGTTHNSAHSQHYHKTNHSSICLKDENTAFVYGDNGLASIDIRNKNDIKLIQHKNTHTTGANASIAYRDNLV